MTSQSGKEIRQSQNFLQRKRQGSGLNRSLELKFDGYVLQTFWKKLVSIFIHPERIFAKV